MQSRALYAGDNAADESDFEIVEKTEPSEDSSQRPELVDVDNAPPPSNMGGAPVATIARVKDEPGTEPGIAPAEPAPGAAAAAASPAQPAPPTTPTRVKCEPDAGMPSPEPAITPDLAGRVHVPLTAAEHGPHQAQLTGASARASAERTIKPAQPAAFQRMFLRPARKRKPERDTRIPAPDSDGKSLNGASSSASVPRQVRPQWPLRSCGPSTALAPVPTLLHSERALANSQHRNVELDPQAGPARAFDRGQPGRYVAKPAAALPAARGAACTSLKRKSDNMAYQETPRTVVSQARPEAASCTPTVPPVGSITPKLEGACTTSGDSASMLQHACLRHERALLITWYQEQRCFSLLQVRTRTQSCLSLIVPACRMH